MTSFQSYASPEFWDLNNRLPVAVRRIADKQFALFRRDPTHPSLHMKPVGELWSARVTDAYRVLAVREGNIFYWFGIGPQDQYERLISG